MTRLNPFTHVFGDAAGEWFEPVRREAAALHRDCADRAQFAALASVQQLLTRIESPETLDATPAAAAEYLLCLYVAFRFWEAGQHIYPVATAAIIDSSAAAAPLTLEIAVPHGACYLQLAEQAFWGQIDDHAPHEPLDGVFVTEYAGGDELTTVAVLGLRPERAGFSQIGMTIARDDLPAAAAAVRPVPFEPTMAGGDRAGFHSLASSSELARLVQLALFHVTTVGSSQSP